jgi:hypothetical protein
LLKTWLREHKKNPYPTKTEKVMLAYAGRMTMTQISNWFANARRRMKQQKDQGSISDSALSDVSEDDDSICKSPTPVGDLYTNAALKGNCFLFLLYLVLFCFLFVFGLCFFSNDIYSRYDRNIVHATVVGNQN